ncbi:MAG: hypothetical protein WBY44_11990 [Bryobacteraceae bacterium]
MTRVFVVMLACHRIVWRVVATLGGWLLIVALVVGCAVLFVMVPDWFTNEKSLAVATWGLFFATCGLVFATLILFFDSRSKGEEQRKRWEREDASRAKEQKERWEREDRIREEDGKPKVAIELAQRDDAPEIVFRCYNLGSTIFFIDQMVVTFFDQAQTANRTFNISATVGPPVLLPGTFTSTTYDCTEFLTDGFREANIVFVLRGSHGLVPTEPVWFYIFRDGAGYGWRTGRLAERLPGAIVRQPRSISEGQ